MIEEFTCRRGFELKLPVRKLIEKVVREAAEPANAGELGAWAFGFARLAVMTESELRQGGCPDDQIEPLQRLALAQAVEAACVGGVPPTPAEVSEFIARIARLTWGSKAAKRLYWGWLQARFPTAEATTRRPRLIH